MCYDLLVIGNDPAGLEQAVAAARNRWVGVIQPKPRTPHIFIEELRRPPAEELLENRLARQGIDVLTGNARFLDPHHVEVVGATGRTVVEADDILIACGTRPARPGRIPFDGNRVFDADDIRGIETLPQLLVIVGGGTTGLSHAVLLTTLAVDVTVVDGRHRLLDETLFHQAQSLGANFRLGKEAVGIDRLDQGGIVTWLEGGERLVGEAVLYSVERLGNTDHLNLQAAGLQPDERGRLWCDDEGRTWVPHIRGAGEVVGFPAPTTASVHTAEHVRECVGV